MKISISKFFFTLWLLPAFLLFACNPPGEPEAGTRPSAPQSFLAVPSATEVMLRWEPPASNGGSAITSYQLFRGMVSSSTSVVDAEFIAPLAGHLTTYTDSSSSLIIGETYLYKLIARNASNKASPPATRVSGLFDGTAPPNGYTLGDSGTITGTELVIAENTIGIYVGEYKEHTPSLTSVTIPDSVSDIGERAFSSNRLESLIIPDSVITIGDSAFVFNTLSSIKISDTVSSIGISAFANNQLKSVFIPDSVTFIATSAFSANQLESVILSGSLITIPRTAFASNALSSIKIPDSVTSIGVGAFTNNQLKSVLIPDSVTSIGIIAFTNNPALETVTLSQDLFDKIKDGAAAGTATKEKLDAIFGSQVTRYQKHDGTIMTP